MSAAAAAAVPCLTLATALLPLSAGVTPSEQLSFSCAPCRTMKSAACLF